MQWHFRASVYILRLTHKKKHWDALVVRGHRCKSVPRVSSEPVRLLVTSHVVRKGMERGLDSNKPITSNVAVVDSPDARRADP
jgi:hypothetical protein